MRDPDPRPWWWLTEAERAALGLGAAVQRTATGFLLGDEGAPYRLEVLPRDESAPVKLGSVSLRLHGELERADARRAIYEAARALHARRGRGFDPGSVTLAAPEPVPRSLTIVDVPSVCDRACTFCHRSLEPLASRRPRGSDAEVVRAIDAAPSDLLFTGDDALSHPRIEEWIARASARAVGRVSLIGPPRALRAAALARAGLASFSTGIFGGDAEAHDEIAGRAGAFREILEASRSLASHGVRVELVTPLVRAVLPHLRAIDARARSLTGRPVTLLAYVPDTDVGSSLDACVAPFDALRDALEALGDDGPRVDALPICALPPAWRSDAARRLDRTDPGLAIVYPAETCGACDARPACPGVAATVLRATGGRGLRALPITG